jgi:malate/lactate dehydrogenase
MLGTHDSGVESEFAAWSTARISGAPISESEELLREFNSVFQSEWAAKTRQRGRDITDIKGAPTFSIASSVSLESVVMRSTAEISTTKDSSHRVHDYFCGLPSNPTLRHLTR